MSAALSALGIDTKERLSLAHQRIQGALEAVGLSQWSIAEIDRTTGVLDEFLARDPRTQPAIGVRP